MDVNVNDCCLFVDSVNDVNVKQVKHNKTKKLRSKKSAQGNRGSTVSAMQKSKKTPARSESGTSKSTEVQRQKKCRNSSNQNPDALVGFQSEEKSLVRCQGKSTALVGFQSEEKSLVRCQGKPDALVGFQSEVKPLVRCQGKPDALVGFQSEVKPLVRCQGKSETLVRCQSDQKPIVDLQKENGTSASFQGEAAALMNCQSPDEDAMNMQPNLQDTQLVKKSSSSRRNGMKVHKLQTSNQLEDNEPAQVIRPKHQVPEDPKAEVPADVERDAYHVVRTTKAVTMKVSAVIEGFSVSAVVDSGAEVTVLSDKIYQSIPQAQRPRIHQAAVGLKVAEKDKSMETSGVANITVELGGKSYIWPMYIAPISDDLLIGCDFLDDKDITLNTRRGMKLNGNWIPCNITRRSRRSRATLEEDVTIPGNHEAILHIAVSQDGYLTEDYALLEPENPEDFSFLIARTLVSTQVPKLPLRCMNISDEPITLKKGYPIGELHPVDPEDIITIWKSEVPEEEPFPEDSECPDLEVSEEDQQTDQQHDTVTNGGTSRCIMPPYLKRVYQRHCEDKVGTSREGLNLPTSPVIPEDWQSEDASEEFVVQNVEELEMPDYLTETYQRNCEKIESQKTKSRLASFLIKHQKTFAANKLDNGRFNLLKHKINTGLSAPIRQPLRRTPRGFENEEEQHLKDQLQAGIVQPSSSSWASNICLVRKKDQTVRWCIDFRRLNEVTVKDAYPLPRIDTCIDCLAGAKFFSTLDLQSGYWQIEVDEADRHKTAFITKYGLYEYIKMPFGLCNAPSTFQRSMELIFRGLQWKNLLIYLDDLIIYSDSVDSHFDRLEEVMNRIAEVGLKLKPSKCQFLQTEVLFLGHVVSQEGVRPNPELLEVIKNWAVPADAKQVQRFIGLCNYYRSFVHKFSDIAAPLNKLAHSGNDFEWTDQAQRSFEFLKHALCNPPILAYPLPGLPYILDTDASGVGIGGVLSQLQEGKERVISYASKSLAKEQRRYNVTRRELLAVITFMKQFRHYLLGQKFRLRTDHGSLRWLFNFKEPEGQVARWLEYLSQFNFDIEHREGRKHSNADALSRLPQYENTTAEPIEQMEEWQDFNQEVDDVVPLGGNHAPKLLRCNRVTTRSQVLPVNTPNDNDTRASKFSLKSYWADGHTTKEMIQLQREDPDIGPFQDWFDRDVKPTREEVVRYSPGTRKLWLNWNNLEQISGVLYQKWKSDHEGMPDVLQLLIPRILRREVLLKCHDHIFSGHLGVERTVKKIKSRFYWYQMSKDVKHHLHTCAVCSANRNPVKKFRAPLQSYLVGAPMDRVAVDIMGPLPETKRNNKYVLVLGDYFTRWVEAYGIPDQQAETVAERIVHEFYSRFGVSLELHSDQGRQFESNLLQDVCKLLKIKKTRTTSYHPASNGLIERFNRTLARMIRSFAVKNTDWDLHLPLLTAAYRSTVHPATGFTPNMLMLNREVHLPVDLLFPRPRSKERVEVHEYVAELRAKMEQCYDIARRNLKNAATRQKRDYDTRIKEQQYQPGDLVYRRNHIQKKLEIPWQGPLVIVKVLSDSVYKVADKKKTINLHHDLLRPYTSSSVPKWAFKIRKEVHKSQNLSQ